MKSESTDYGPGAQQRAAITRRIAEATEPRTVTVTCDICFEDYDVRYRDGVRLPSTHVCTGKRPAPANGVLVL